MRYARNPEALWRSTSRGPVVLLPGRALPTRLSGLAAVVWELLDEPLGPEQLTTEAMHLLDVRPDLTSCLDDLVAAEMVVPITSG